MLKKHFTYKLKKMEVLVLIMAKRSTIISILMAAILTAILEVLTMEMMNYNIFSVIVSSFLYFMNIMFIEAGIYFAIKSKEKEYHLFSTLAYEAVLVVQITVYYLVGNLKSIQILEVWAVTASVVMFSYLTYFFFKLAKKHCTFTYYDEY